MPTRTVTVTVNTTDVADGPTTSAELAAALHRAGDRVANGARYTGLRDTTGATLGHVAVH